MEQLYPKLPKEPRDTSNRRWGVDYHMMYDGGGAQWVGYYRTRWGARVAAWWIENISSWGGSAVLFDNAQVHYADKYSGSTYPAIHKDHTDYNKEN